MLEYNGGVVSIIETLGVQWSDWEVNVKKENILILKPGR